MKATLTNILRTVVCSSVLTCANPLGPVPDGSLMTDATRYVALPIAGSTRPRRYQFRVITRFQNRSAASVYLGRCFPNSPQPIYSILPADSSAPESAYDAMWACVGHNNQFEVLPGAVRVDTLRVVGPNVYDEIKQQAIGVTNGVFRLSLDIASAPGGAPRLSGSLGVSNAFVVRTLN
jgi:hypothetical protein